MITFSWLISYPDPENADLLKMQKKCKSINKASDNKSQELEDILVITFAQIKEHFICNLTNKIDIHFDFLHDYHKCCK